MLKRKSPKTSIILGSNNCNSAVTYVCAITESYLHMRRRMEEVLVTVIS